jgi:hypothetical protein
LNGVQTQEQLDALIHNLDQLQWRSRKFQQYVVSQDVRSSGMGGDWTLMVHLPAGLLQLYFKLLFWRSAQVPGIGFLYLYFQLLCCQCKKCKSIRFCTLFLQTNNWSGVGHLLATNYEYTTIIIGVMTLTQYDSSPDHALTDDIYMQH